MKLSKSIWGAIGAVGLLLAVFLIVVAAQRADAPSGLKSFAVQGGGEADKFQGRVTRVVAPVSEDGANYMEVDGHILVLVDAGGLKPREGGVKGSLVGGISSGSKVEVYAEKAGKDSYTLYGNKNYYVKAVQ